MGPGQALAFVMLGMVNLYLGLWFAGYAAHWFLLALDETATGTNVVRLTWPDDGYRDRLWKAAHLSFRVGIWLLPVLLLLRYWEMPVPPEQRPFVGLLLVGVVLWLMLPISLISSMTADGQWEFFRLNILLRLVRQAPVTAAFYGYTLPLLLGSVLVAYLALFGYRQMMDSAPGYSEMIEIWSWAFVVPFTGAMAAAVLLIYARLVGRLAWMLDLDDEEEEAETVAPTQPQGRPRVVAMPAAPPTDTYALVEEAAPVPAVVVPAPSPPTAVPSAEPPVRRRLWVSGIYRFPWYRGSLRAWIFLSLFGILLGLMLRLQMMVAS